jgi:hypothetical protein
MLKDQKIKEISTLGRVFNVDYNTAFKYLADPNNLPQWALAFSAADEKTAILLTPDKSKIECKMDTISSHDLGVIDWHIYLPDGAVEVAYSRLHRMRDGRCFYGMSFHVRPVVKSEIKSTLLAQSADVEKEFDILENIFEVIVKNNQL